MGNLLADLLSADQPGFSLSLEKLEKSSGNPSVDVRLMSEIIQISKLKTIQLGLDKDDITGKELYYSLINKARLHDKHLITHIGIKKDSRPEIIAQAIKSSIEKTELNKNVWVIRKSVIKKFIKQTPPLKIMKLLGYSSIDSMIKRENLYEILGAARLIESHSWLTKFNKAYKNLMPSDFETRKIEIYIMPNDRWSSLSKSLYKQNKFSFTHFKELGFISVLPPDTQQTEGYCLLVLPAILHYINEIRLYSAYFKLQQVKSNFGKTIVDTLNEDKLFVTKISGKQIHWRVIQRHYGRSDKINHPDIFQPHLQPEDLQWRRAEEDLFTINPELSFWRGLDFIGINLRSNTPVSFNLLDVSMNSYFNINFNQRIVSHMRASLWNEIFMRYLGQSVFENQLLTQLDEKNLYFDELKF